MHVLVRNRTLAGSQTEGGVTMKLGQILWMPCILSDTSLKLACVSEVTGYAWRSVVENRVTIGNERGVRE